MNITMKRAFEIGCAIMAAAILAVCLFPTFSYGITTSSQTVNDRTITRFAGVHRYDTSALINIDVARAGTYSGVIVCSGENGKFADALSASGLSGAMNYPVVLVNGTQGALDNAVRYTIGSLIGGNKANVIVLGGVSSISEGIANSLSVYDDDATVTRLWGADRFETSEKVYYYGLKYGDWSTDYAIVAKGNDFPDALGAASFCTANAAPMLLTDSDSNGLSLAITSAAAAADEAVILGGLNSVSADKEDELVALTSAERLGGTTRYDTNLAFVLWEIEHGMSVSTIGLATGETFPDALGSNYLLSLTNSPLLLAPKTDVAEAADPDGATDAGDGADGAGDGGDGAGDGDGSDGGNSDDADENGDGGTGDNASGDIDAEAGAVDGSADVAAGIAANLATPANIATVGVATNVATTAGIAAAAAGTSNTEAILYGFIGQHAKDISVVDIFGGTVSVSDTVEASIATILETFGD